MWNQELYQKAIAFAAHAHRDQLVPGTDYSYVVHLANVAAELARAMEVDKIGDPDLAMQAALLHDVVEDAHVEFARIEEVFGAPVRKAVQALTKDETLPRERRMRDSLDRIRACGREAACVKLADRITNLQPPPAAWSRDKRRAYAEEATVIRSELGFASPFLAERLGRKIEEYRAAIYK